jgi:hypothetical protein
METTDTTFITVVGREGNRRDAMIGCGLCGKQFVPMHFYEAPGTPTLDGGLLWIFHYEHCVSVSENRDPITVRLGWDDNRAPEIFVFAPATRTLVPAAT